MKRLLAGFTGLLALWTVEASAQCSGILSAGSLCGNPTATGALGRGSRTPILGLPGTALGTLGLAGNTSGTVTIKPQAAAGTYNFNLPTTAGSAGQPLISGGGGATAMSFPAMTLTNGMITTTPTNLFWNTAKIHRLGDRILAGSAVVNDGTFPFTSLDWFSALSTVPINGGDPLLEGVDLDVSQVAVLANGSVPPTQSGNPALPVVGLLTAAQSLDNKQPRAFQAHIINNAPGGDPLRSAWGIYTTATRYPGVTGSTYGYESEVRNSGSLVKVDPFSVPLGAQFNFLIAAGSGSSAVGQNDVSAALFIGNNPMKYTMGILFGDGGIGAHGPGTTKAAIGMPFDYQVQWYASAGVLASSIYSDGFNNLILKSGAGGLVAPQSSVALPDGTAVYGWGANTTYIAGSSATTNISFVTNGVERGRYTTAGLNIPTNSRLLFTGTPSTNLQVDAQSATVSVTNGGNASIAMLTGFVFVKHAASGAVAMYNVQGGTIQSVALGAGGIWVNATTTPGAGNASVAFSGSDIRIYNNVGATSNFSVLQLVL